jgi:hypothetical protein
MSPSLPKELQSLVYQFLGYTKLFRPYGIDPDSWKQEYCEFEAIYEIRSLIDDPEFSDITQAQLNTHIMAHSLARMVLKCEVSYNMNTGRDFEWNTSTFLWFVKWASADGRHFLSIPEFPPGR